MSHNDAVDALFVSPHPDDVEIFCGATVATLAGSGHDVVLVDLTQGELASNGTVEERRASSLEAARILGARPERPVLGLPDGGIDDARQEQVDAVVRVLRALRPRLLVGPHPRDRHPDHEAAGGLLRRAAFFAGVGRYQPSLGEPHRPDRILFYPCHHDVEVDLLVDVATGMEAWREAVAVHSRQFERGEADVPTWINRPGFVSSHEARRAHWGARVGLDHAEGFVHEGPWRVDRSSELLGGRS